MPGGGRPSEESQRGFSDIYLFIYVLFIFPEEEQKKKKSIGSYQWAVVRGRDKEAAAGRVFGC